MSLKPPPDRRKFADAWDEVEYLRDKLLYWLYQRQDTDKARPYAERLERLLPGADPDHEAILGEECRSLLHEAKGDLAKAIQHREREIELIRRLHDLARDDPHRELILKDYGFQDWSDCLDLLAVLYHDSGKLHKALRTLEQSEEMCRQQGLRFDGADLVREYRKEKSAVENGLGGTSRTGKGKRLKTRSVTP